MGGVTEPADPPSPYWRQTLRLSAVLLALWLLLTLGLGWFGRALDFSVLGWHFGFWATAQGALLAYCLIVWYCAWAMNRLDEQQGQDDHD